MLFDSQNSKSFVFDCVNTNDNGIDYDAFMKTAIKPGQDGGKYLANVQSFLERADGYGTVEIELVLANMLESREGQTTLSANTLDLNIQPVDEYVGFNESATYFGLEYSWKSSTTVKWKGALVYGRRVD